jgi:ABC-type transport system involved in multi-copper enzyme maturation permease subunit
MLRQIHTIAFYTLLEALRNHLIWLVALVVMIGAGLSVFLHELAITESRQIQVALLASLLRFCAVFLIAAFVVTSMAREFNDKGLDLLLALPLPRAAYLLGKLTGFAALALLPALLFGLLAAFFAHPMQTMLWTASLVCELWLIAACSLACVLTFKQILPALSAVAGFYMLARSVGTLQLIGHNALNNNTLSQQVINVVLDTISTLLPHLDLFTSTEWLTYDTGTWAILGSLLMQTLVYLILLTGVALFDLYRKNL